MLIGLSDHTPGHAAVLGAVALGARTIEKHFTDDNLRTGPDHKFALNPLSWQEMVARTRELEFALGDGEKRIEENETETVVIQRRSLRFKSQKNAGEKISASDLEALRPCPLGALTPEKIEDIIGKTLIIAKNKGEELYWNEIN